MRNLWKNMPIVKKLTAVMIVIISAFCLVTFVGQFAFFEKYYTRIKSGEALRAANEFAKLCEEGATEEELYTGIAETADKYGCYLMTIGADGAMEYAASYIMTLRTEDGSFIRFTLDNAAMSKDFKALAITEGDTVSVKYLSDNEEHNQRTFFPVSITKGGSSWGIWRRDFERERRAPQDREMTAEGAVASIVLPSEQTRNINTERASAMKAAGDWISERAAQSSPAAGKSVRYLFTDDETSQEFSVAVRSLSHSGAVVIAITPLAMVAEAVVVLKYTYTVWFALALLAACAVGIVFAKLLTKPVVEITDITKSMAALDFSRSCTYSANDEIGELAENINLLSGALDRTICKLREANDRLMHDIERERTLERSRREFVAAASHELKTPLGIIRAYTEAIADGISENKRRHYSEVIIEETEKMDRLILDMLDNTKLESGAQKTVMAEYDISEMLGGVYSRFADVLAHKGIHGSLACVHAVCRFDADMIERVLTNFMSNAVANTPEGGQIICTTARDGGKIRVSVENSGSHIPDDEIGKVWDRFYKADKSRQRSRGGTGLGLSIAKNILLLHNAEYRAENTEIGVKFSFWL